MSETGTPESILQLIGAGRFREAEKICLAGRERTGDAEYVYLLAITRAQQRKFDDAIKLFEQASAAKPDRADIAYNFGVICQTAGNMERAVAEWRRTSEIDPAHQDAFYNMALGLDRLGRAEEAAQVYETLLKINADHANALYNLANLKVRLDDPGAALALFERLLAKRPDFEAAWINAGLAAQRAGDFEDAERRLRRALALNPQSVEAHWNLANLLLLLGRWREGFAEYEWRLARPQAPRPDWSAPRWDGTPATDKRLLLWVDQGVGDAIQFLRYARFAAERVGTVIVRCQDALVRLAASVPGVDAAVSIDDPLPAFDCHLPLMSLAHVLALSEPAASWQGPYVAPPAAFDLDDAHGVTRVGLVWAGNPAHRNDANRSCGLRVLKPLLATADTSFFSLQVGPGRAELSAERDFAAVTDLAPRLNDFADTAAAIAALDLVVSVDTAAAHLAGALGKPTWVLIPAVDPDWRWQRARTETDWYPDVKLFRQAAPGNWTDTVSGLARALEEFAHDAERHG